MNMSKQFELSDWLAISNAIHVYCRGLDRCDAASLSSVFWPEAVINLGGDVDLTGAIYSDRILPSLKQLFAKTMHQISNIVIEGRGNTANSECSLMAYHALKQEHGRSRDFLVGGRYLDRWEKRSVEWRMIHRQLVWDWHRTLGDTQDWQECLLGPPRVLGDYWPQDPLYTSR
jgi:hypothetical protein